MTGQIHKTTAGLLGLIATAAFAASMSAQSPAPSPVATPAGTIQKQKFNLNKQGEDRVGYTQAIKVGNTIHLSGTVGGGPDMATQLRKAYGRIEQTLAHYGAGPQHVVKEVVYTTKMDDLIKSSGDVRREFYKSDWPAATWVQVSRLFEPELMVEIDVIAVLPE